MEYATAGTEFATERDRLAVLGREYLLAGHLLDRGTMPQIIARWGADSMTELAIEEWMGASPVYTRRMQRALNFQGDDVPTIFKGMQFDVGAPHQFLDFRFTIDDPMNGGFTLAHCGALMDVEPMGEDFVVAMCHDIEDPTFDATAVATNPHAQVRPIHRPPRIPSDRSPHCQWTVKIVPEAEPVVESDNYHLVAASLAAALDLPAAGGEAGDPPADGGGWADYSGEFDPDFQLELLSVPALRTVLDEVSLQGHLLVRSMMIAIEQRHGLQAAEEVTRSQFKGVAPLAASRLKDAMGIEGDGLDAVAAVLEIHPAFRPAAYVDLRVSGDGQWLRVALGPSAAFDEGDTLSWPEQLKADPSILAPLVQAINPRAVCEAAPVEADEVVAWQVTIDPTAEPARVPDEVVMARFSTGADFELRKPLPVAL